MSCGIGHRQLGSGMAVVVARRLAAAAPHGPLAWVLPYDTGAALKCKKKKKKKIADKSTTGQIFAFFFFFFFFFSFFKVTPNADLSPVCDLYHSSRQRWILNPLSKGRDLTRNLMVPS